MNITLHSYDHAVYWPTER